MGGWAKTIGGRWEVGLAGCRRWTLKNGGRWEVGPANRLKLRDWPKQQVRDGMLRQCLVVLRTGAGDERVPSRATCCVLLVRKD